jgi:hypothetical protein
MKRFLLFHFDPYEPNGGWNDFYGAFDTLAEAESKLPTLSKGDKYQIIDLTQPNEPVQEGKV